MKQEREPAVVVAYPLDEVMHEHAPEIHHAKEIPHHQRKGAIAISDLLLDPSIITDHPPVIREIHILLWRWNRARQIAHFGPQLHHGPDARKVELCVGLKTVFKIQAVFTILWIETPLRRFNVCTDISRKYVRILARPTPACDPACGLIDRHQLICPGEQVAT